MRSNSKNLAIFLFLCRVIMGLKWFLVCRGCLLVFQSLFHNEPKNFVDIGGGVVGCRGFHSSFRATALLVKPGPVMDFLLDSQKVEHPNLSKWDKEEATTSFAENKAKKHMHLCEFCVCLEGTVEVCPRTLKLKCMADIPQAYASEDDIRLGV
ncbi:Protein argonaute 9 [Abeliophyllum distichum]|uniref:Protein argonaute 9 n=1 Tax=Abeliophyllum distichum TaxID=126358 RepID=A0ABD1TG73_9LAMI